MYKKFANLPNLFGEIFSNLFEERIIFFLLKIFTSTMRSLSKVLLILAFFWWAQFKGHHFKFLSSTTLFLKWIRLLNRQGLEGHGQSKVPENRKYIEKQSFQCKIYPTILFVLQEMLHISSLWLNYLYSQ